MSLDIGVKASEILVLEMSFILQMFHITLYVTITALTGYVLYNWMHDEFSDLGLGK